MTLPILWTKPFVKSSVNQDSVLIPLFCLLSPPLVLSLLLCRLSSSIHNIHYLLVTPWLKVFIFLKLLSPSLLVSPLLNTLATHFNCAGPLSAPSLRIINLKN